ncbi:TRAP transporter large permease [Elioraea sp.]|uniref:TRAP transporter large permease n=1 Tax=Elioraea sp. TaxID=2185103 RepID=UPI0021DCFD49|nr:TRAP transporter large permease [Elioraea sp.]GIX08810.1 MAG: C4-dicarboxylate ABC transporter permease [Elioraea sp.]
MTLAVLLGTMLGLAMLGVPLVFALLAASLVSLLLFRPGVPLEVVPQFFVGGMDNFALLAIALFFLAGELMGAAGVTTRILDFARAMVGHIRGGLAQVGIVASFVMAGISGSAVADAAAVGSVLIRSMRQAGYPAPFAAALIETASILGPIIPPSIPMIVYAVLAGVSVGSMFLAGIVPGVLIALGLGLVAHRRAGRLALPREPRADAATRLGETARASAALLAPVIIVGGIRGGAFTATEAGGIAALYVMLIGTLVYRGLTPAGFWHALVQAARGTASVLVILGASSIFAWIIADQGVSRAFAAAIAALEAPPAAVLLLLNLLFFAIGMFLDPIAALIILVPIFLPMVQALGIDLVQFGVMTVLNLMIGLCTPPVGYLIYLTATMAEASPGAVIRASLPFLAVLVAVLLLVTYVPAVTLWLPAAVTGR